MVAPRAGPAESGTFRTWTGRMARVFFRPSARPRTMARRQKLVYGDSGNAVHGITEGGSTWPFSSDKSMFAFALKPRPIKAWRGFSQPASGAGWQVGHIRTRLLTRPASPQFEMGHILKSETRFLSAAVRAPRSRWCIVSAQWHAVIGVLRPATRQATSTSAHKQSAFARAAAIIAEQHLIHHQMARERPATR